MTQTAQHSRFIVQRLQIRRTPTYRIVDTEGVMPAWEFWGEDGPRAEQAAEFLNRGCTREMERIAFMAGASYGDPEGGYDPATFRERERIAALDYPDTGENRGRPVCARGLSLLQCEMARERGDVVGAPCDACAPTFFPSDGPPQPNEAYADAINEEEHLRASLAEQIGLSEEERDAYDWFHASDRQLPYVVHRQNRSGVVDAIKLAPARIVTFQRLPYAVSWNHEWRCVAFWTYDDVVRGLADTIRKEGSIFAMRGMTAPERDALAGLCDLDHAGNPEPVE